MPGIEDIIILGIKAGIKISRQYRQAYVEGTLERELVLPLPNFNPNITDAAAQAYFRGGGRRHLADYPRAQELFDKADADQITPQERNELLIIYKEFKLADDIKSGTVTGGEIGLSGESLLAMVTIRQWSRNSPFPSAIQRVVGSLIEIGIDYLEETPGAINDKSAPGRALKGFLKSIGQLNFAEERVDQLAKGLFIGAIETISENPDLWGADDKTEILIEAVSTGLAIDIKDRIEQIGGANLSKQEKIEDWGQLVLRSVLSNAGEVVLANPRSYLGINAPGQQALVSSVGTSILDVIIDEDAVDFSELLSREGLDRIVKSALLTFSENPGLIGTDHKGLQNVLTQIARDLSASTEVLGPDMLPDIIQLVLEKTALNADLLWPAAFRNDPEKHLLITASKELLGKLAEKPAGADTWTPRLSKSQVLDVLETVLDEVVQNPAWLVETADAGGTVLGVAVESALSALRKVPANRLNAETGKEVLISIVSAVALRKDFLDSIQVSGESKVAITAVLDTIIDATLMGEVDSKALWVLARGEVFAVVASAGLDRMAQIGISAETLEKLDTLLKQTVNDLIAGETWNVESLIESIDQLAA